MKKWKLIVGCMLCLSAVNAQKGTELQILKHVNFFSTDLMKERSAGSEAERLSNNYIRENWASGKRTSFYSWEYELNQDTVTLTSEMVGSFLYNKAKATILLAADLESASDIAVLLGLQNELAELKLDVNVMVVSVTSFNNGHQGLDHLLTHMPKKARDIRLLIHMNEVGGMSKENPILTITSTAGIFEELQLMPKQFELAQAEDSLLSVGEEKTYVQKGIQCLVVSAKDDESKLNTHGLHQTQDFLVQWVITK
jgi:hypothetical protein